MQFDTPSCMEAMQVLKSLLEQVISRTDISVHVVLSYQAAYRVCIIIDKMTTEPDK